MPQDDSGQGACCGVEVKAFNIQAQHSGCGHVMTHLKAHQDHTMTMCFRNRSTGHGVVAACVQLLRCANLLLFFAPGCCWMVM